MSLRTSESESGIHKRCVFEDLDIGDNRQEKKPKSGMIDSRSQSSAPVHNNDGLMKPIVLVGGKGNLFCFSTQAAQKDDFCEAMKSPFPSGGGKGSLSLFSTQVPQKDGLMKPPLFGEGGKGGLMKPPLFGEGGKGPVFCFSTQAAQKDDICRAMKSPSLGEGGKGSPSLFSTQVPRKAPEEFKTEMTKPLREGILAWCRRPVSPSCDKQRPAPCGICCGPHHQTACDLRYSWELFSDHPEVSSRLSSLQRNGNPRQDILPSPTS